MSEGFRARYVLTVVDDYDDEPIMTGEFYNEEAMLEKLYQFEQAIEDYKAELVYDDEDNN